MDAVRAFARAAPKPIRVTDAFRTPEQQQRVRERKPTLAAPGTSAHELGRAVDLEGVGWDADDWMVKNYKRFGLRWTRPDEPWHYEI